MGLDMYLTAERYLWSFPEDGADAKLGNAIGAMFSELPSSMKIQTVKAELASWRKANAIHKWFVDNVQEGTDDCGSYHVRWDQLSQLRELCKQVIANPDLASKLLPAQSGFFFGATDYDEWYFNKLAYTVEVIDLIDTELMTETSQDGTSRYSKWDISYTSSW